MNGGKPLLPSLQWDIIKTSLQSSRLLVAGFLLTTIAASASAVAGPLLLSRAVARLASAPPLLTLSLLLLFAVTAALARCLQEVKAVLSNRLEQDVRNLSSKKIMDALVSAEGSLFAQNNPSKISVMVESWHQSNKIYIQLYLMVLMGGVADVAFSFLAVGGAANWLVALFVLAYGAVLVLIAWKSNRVTKVYQAEAQASSNEGSNVLGNAIENIISIRVFRAQPWIAELYDRQAAATRRAWLSFYGARLRCGALQAILLFVQYASILGLSLWLYDRSGEIGGLVMVSLILVQLNRPFELIGMSIRDITVARGMARPLQALLDAHAPAAPPAMLERMPISGSLTISISALSFGYERAASPLLSGITGEFKPGVINFIIGRSGAGKSTLMQLLLKMHQGYSGLVRVGSLDLGTIDPEDYLAHVGYVPPEPMMMNLSIRENVLLGRPFSDADVFHVLECVHLADKVTSLRDGLDYRVGERGQLLSGGERQRLAIARALIARPRLLLLDEASSGLDEQTERGIFDELRQLVSDTTIIAITHRRGVISPRDYVLDLSSSASARASPVLA
ncbi:ABC transporter ATP-binding protein [Bradyrhizobium sp. CB1650]|uniref:ABC transporter ATP-binding protein n=1 Tax=Bradyrhizobium sp. CB1650 TaxID=3039153 RepID=UPI00243546E3|nr:ABC transporter ATP-binding protein [Bradyrhizobium sp. CB1650]WGD51256.1 ABC transporter ATP-binding protein [Bradyrhizobium sp. CB1650]